MNFIIGSTGFLSKTLLKDIPNQFSTKSLLSLRKNNLEEILKIIKDNSGEETSNIVFASWPTRINYDDIKHIDFLRDSALPLIKELSLMGCNFRLITYGTCLEYGLAEGPLKEDKLAIPCTKIGTAKLMLYDYCKNLLKKGQYTHLKFLSIFSFFQEQKHFYLF